MPGPDAALSRRALIASASGFVLFGLSGEKALASRTVLLKAGTVEGAMDEFERVPILPRTLRGFGRLRGETTARGVMVDCESSEKADLLLAKYRGDVAAFGHVEAIRMRSQDADLPAWKIADVLYVAAFRQGARVSIDVAETPEALAQAVRAKAKAGEDMVFDAASSVPMYLDRWDRYGLLFYYPAFQEPPGFDASKQRYDFRGDFDFAQKEANSGFVFWADESANDTAEGMMNTPWWDWGRNEALSRKMPVQMNTTAIPTTWLLNRYREETALKMPQFSGSFYRVADPRLGGNGVLSWGSGAGMDAELGVIQSTVRRFVDDPNVVGWLEPHSELGHGKQQLFLEYGPASDRSFREFLRARYKSLDRLNASRGTHCRAWDDLQAPELAEFQGWGERALDLKGRWQVRHEEMRPGEVYNPDGWRVAERRPVQTLPAPAEWFQPGFDDRDWGGIDAPGSDRTMFLQKRPAVYRRRFDLPADWNPERGRVWLFVWDLNMAEGDLTVAYVNGTKAGEAAIPFWTPQWCAFEVTQSLKEGANALALRLPNGYLGYRIYLSTSPPQQFPYLGKGANARWVDFADWTADLRRGGVGRGVEMIRQVDPNRPVTLMSPDVYVDVVKEIAQRYGGNMHDTGLMAGLWCDLYPMLSRSSGLPFDLEPGGGPSSAEDFRLFIGRYLTEGIQGLSYFMTVGDVLWHDDVRGQFERYRPLLALMGKHHIPKAEVALLFSQRCERLLGYPWSTDYNEGLPNGYWSWNVAANLLPLFPRDGLTEPDFSNGNADSYRVVIDTSTTVMDHGLIDDVERWVRDGGIFVAFLQTGRHSLTEPDSWPVSRLTGYDVTQVERYDGEGKVPESEWRGLRAAPGQDVFAAGDWGKGNGLSLRKRAPDCRDLMLWEDGTVAVGMRPLGKGHVVHVGAKFSHHGIPDRIEVGEDTPATQRLTALFAALLEWQKVARVPGRVGGPGDPVILRHSESNTGLFDVWTLHNRTKEAQTATLGFEAPPTWCREVGSGEQTTPTDLRFGPLETRIFVTPRTTSPNAPEAWLRLQMDWWRAGPKPPAKRLPQPQELQRNALSLSEDWAFLPLRDEDDAAKMSQPRLDDAACERRALGVWGLRDHGDVRRALFRKRFVVPKRWTKGGIELWIQSWTNTTFLDEGRVFLDGQPLGDLRSGGLSGESLGDRLRPGTAHVLAIEIGGEGQLRGVRGNAWLSFLPEPKARVDLTGSWTPSADPLHDEAPIPLPGPWNTLMARRTVRVDDAFKHLVATICVIGEPRVLGVMVNGAYVRRHHHGIGKRTSLNVTPWIRFGEENEVALVSWDGPSQGRIESVELQFFDRKDYA